MFVAERFFVTNPSISTLQLMENAQDSLDYVNSVLSGQNANLKFVSEVRDANGTLQMAFRIAPSSLPCFNNYQQPCTQGLRTDIADARVNEDIARWRREDSVDVVVLLREKQDSVATDGTAYRLALPNNNDNYAWAFASVVRDSGGNFDSLAHELGHILGADHHSSNPDDGVKAVPPIQAYFVVPNHPDYRHSSRTIMAYFSTCTLSLPTPCWLFEKYSSPNHTFTSSTGVVITVGTANHNNFAYMLSNAIQVSRYSNHLEENLPPVAVITKIGGNFKLNQKMTHSATSSADPNGDALIYAWELHKGNTLVKSLVGAAQFNHKYTSIGAYRLLLTAADPDGLLNTATQAFNISLAAPVVTTSQGVSAFTISWQLIAGATDYHVYYREGSGQWNDIPWSQTTTSFSVPFNDMIDNVTYSYRVQACAGNDCSSDSNIVSITDTGSAGGGGDNPPCTGADCPLPDH